MTNAHWECKENSYCEHCGDLESFSIVFMDEHKTSWCEDCAYSLESGGRPLPMHPRLKLESLALKKSFYKKKLEDIEEELSYLEEDYG